MAMGVIGASACFGAVCGSSVATTATIGRAALPELKRYGYDDGLATGTVAVGGTLGILVPPSVILVVYAISTEQNIAKLFMAAMVPGLLARCSTCSPSPSWRGCAPPWRRRAAGWARRSGGGPAERDPGAADRRRGVGGIYGGCFTPTEDAAIGCVSTLAVGLGAAPLRAADVRQRSGDRRDHGDDLRDPARRRGVQRLPALEPGAGPAGARGSASRTSRYGVLALLLLAYIVLGAVMDELAMILLTLPVFFPVVTALDFGLATTEETAIWFGVLVLVVVGIGLTAPPIGLNVFVVSSLARDVPIAKTYRGVLPFLATDVVRLALLVAFPALSLWLVRALAQ
jgi:TRAP-type C4-dicarboxylate transport system permease large subunit